MKNTIPFRIIMISPPAGVDYGIQEGSGSVYKTIQTKRSVGKNLVFDFDVRIGESKDDAPRFLGPVVQGTPDDRFVYIDIGTYAGQKDSAWERRLKIPLRGITIKMIEKVLSDPHLIFETTVPGVAKDTGPNCGTVKPFEGWKIVKSEE
jgi:hypothetical protein